MMIIREFNNKDAEVCSKIRTQNYADVLSQVYTAVEIKNYIELFPPEEIIKHSKNNTIFVVEEDKEIVGFISIGIDKEAKIKLFFVSLGKQGKGIGSKLYSYSEDWIKNNYKDIKKISVHSNIYRPIIRFYESLGFKNKGKVIHDDRGRKLECVLLVKNIK